MTRHGMVVDRPPKGKNEVCPAACRGTSARCPERKSKAANDGLRWGVPPRRGQDARSRPWSQSWPPRARGRWCGGPTRWLAPAACWIGCPSPRAGGRHRVGWILSPRCRSSRRSGSWCCLNGAARCDLQGAMRPTQNRGGGSCWARIKRPAEGSGRWTMTLSTTCRAGHQGVSLLWKLGAEEDKGRLWFRTDSHHYTDVPSSAGPEDTTWTSDTFRVITDGRRAGTAGPAPRSLRRRRFSIVLNNGPASPSSLSASGSRHRGHCARKAARR